LYGINGYDDDGGDDGDKAIISIINNSSNIMLFSCHRFSFFPGTSPLEPVVNPTTQASSLSL
jgi:hypothetical protein